MSNLLSSLSNSAEQCASMSYVTMDKSKLIEILKENKEKHDAIFTAALAGYWDTAKEKINAKQDEYRKAVKELNRDVEYQFNKLDFKLESREQIPNNSSINIKFNFVQNLGVVYPENHTADYEKAIRKLELSIYDKVTLDELEYESYVLNNWAWKGGFLASNSLYLNDKSISNVKGRSAEYVKSVAASASNF